MAKYEPRQPKTPEEIVATRIRNKITLGTAFISIVFYVLIFNFVPKVPNSVFYAVLDNFLNTYLLGDRLPAFSPNFYFSMKVAWCLSFVHEGIMFFILFLLIHVWLRPAGVKTIRNTTNLNEHPIKLRIVLWLIAVFLCFGCFLLSILYYSFGSNTGLRLGSWIDAIFYGNFFPSTLLFLFFQAFFLRFFTLTVALSCYFHIFCKGDLTND